MRDAKLLVVVLGVVVGVAGAAPAEDEGGIEFEVTADFYNKYIWRGQNLVDDWVFQPGFSATYGGLTASFWGNLDLTNVNGSEGEFSEIDLTLDYSGQFPGIDILGYSVGMINYDFPVSGGPDDTTEMYVGLSADVPANPSVTVYRDVDEVKDGAYISLGVGHSFENVFELGPDTPVGVDLSASLGWGNGDYNAGYWGTAPDGGGIGSRSNDLVLSVGFPFELAGLSFNASASYITIAAGLFNMESGLFCGGGVKQLGVQLLGVGSAFVWAFGLGLVLFVAIKKTIGLRVTPEEEAKGLDIGEHGMEAYSGFQIFTTT